jgi:hypothetical protein
LLRKANNVWIIQPVNVVISHKASTVRDEPQTGRGERWGH